jgi:hypothetical protein
METINLNQVVKFIHQQVNENELLSSQLCKAKALAEVAMGNSFLAQDETTQHNYLWALRDLLKDADQLNEQQLSDWMGRLKNFNP